MTHGLNGMHDAIQRSVAVVFTHDETVYGVPIKMAIGCGA